MEFGGQREVVAAADVEGVVQRVGWGGCCGVSGLAGDWCGCGGGIVKIV